MERKYTGVILGKYNIRETDRIYTIYTLEAGKIRALAQGARKPQAKLAGHLEDFNLVDLAVVRKKGMGRITGSIIENNFADMRNNLKALECAFVAARTIDQLTEIEDKDGDSFKLLLQFLEVLDKEVRDEKDNFGLLLQGFIFKLLGGLGYGIEAGSCARCSSALSESGNCFSPELGGVACQNCSKEVKGKIGMSANAVKIIRLFSQNRIGALVKLRASEKDTDNLKVISRRFLKWIKN